MTIFKYIFTFIVSIVFVLLAFDSAESACATLCESDDGLIVGIYQTSDGWEMAIHEGYGNVIATYSGSGQYSCTVCNGVTPCQV